MIMHDTRLFLLMRSFCRIQFNCCQIFKKSAMASSVNQLKELILVAPPEYALLKSLLPVASPLSRLFSFRWSDAWEPGRGPGPVVMVGSLISSNDNSAGLSPKTLLGVLALSIFTAMNVSLLINGIFGAWLTAHKIVR